MHKNIHLNPLDVRRSTETLSLRALNTATVVTLCLATLCVPALAQRTTDNSCAELTTNGRISRPNCTENNELEVFSGVSVLATSSTPTNYRIVVIDEQCDDPTARTIPARTESISTGSPNGGPTTITATVSFTAGIVSAITLQPSVSTGITYTVQDDPSPHNISIPAIPACKKFTYKWRPITCSVEVTFFADQCTRDNALFGERARYWRPYETETNVAVSRLDVVTNLEDCSSACCRK